MIDTSKPVVYVGHPISGSMGKAATPEYMHNNCWVAIKNTRFLREHFPSVTWYCPAEVDLIIQILYHSGKLSGEDILWADCEIIRRYCNGYMGHKWEHSHGIDVEFDAAAAVGIPAIRPEDWGPHLHKGVLLDINDFLVDVEKHYRNTKGS